MKKRTVIVVVSALLAAGLAGAVGLLWVRGTETAQDQPRANATEGQERESGDADKEGKDLDLSIPEILAARCEHKMPTYQCAECRYEVGVVKVDASLLKDSADAKGGLVRTIAVSKGKIETVLRATGEVQLNGNSAAHIAPRISGAICSVKVDIGAQVKKDDLLFEIDSVELGQSLTEYEKSLALTGLSRKNYEREKALNERKIGSERDMIEAQMTYEQNQAELKAAEQKLHVLGLTEKDLDAVKQDPHGVLAGRLPVRAPFDGAIIEKHAVIGELAEPGKDIMLLADLRTVWAWVNIYEQDLPILLQAHQQTIPTKVFVHAFGNRAFDGRMDYIGATMDEQTRTVKVRATVDNQERLLRPGMFCEIQIRVSADKEGIVIPKIALLSDEGQDFVFKHLRDEYYVRRPVKKGRVFDDSVEVLDGLEIGETLIADGAFLLKSDVLRSKMGAGCAD